MTHSIKHRILIVDDDLSICEVLTDLLEMSGFDAEYVPDGDSMKRALSRGGYSLVLMDLRLRHEDGLALARDIRTRSRIPIIMLTAHGDDTDRVLGLETAADDFVMKPFNNRELLARIRALLRRTNDVGDPRALRVDPMSHERYRFGHWIVNLTLRELADVKNGVVCNLTQAEFALLEIMVKTPNRILSRELILASTRGQQTDVLDRTIDVLILRLRRKIEVNSSHPQFIQTERGIGYQFTGQLLRC